MPLSPRGRPGNRVSRTCPRSRLSQGSKPQPVFLRHQGGQASLPSLRGAGPRSPAVAEAGPGNFGDGLPDWCVWLRGSLLVTDTL